MDENTKVNLKYGQLADMVNRIEQIPPLTGTGAPTTSTPAWYIGQRYIDTQTNNAYYCVEIPSSGVVGYVWQPVDTSTSYTAGEGIDITNDVISATNTGKAKVLTTADYNYHSSGSSDDGIAWWLLEPGIYTTEVAANVYANKLQFFSKGALGALIVSRTSNQGYKTLLQTDTNPSGSKLRIITVVASNGTEIQFANGLKDTDIIDNLTSSSSNTPLSANQGRILKNLVDSIATRGAGAPTASTVGTVGQLYEDGTNGALYQLKSIDITVTPNTYNWEQVGGSSAGAVTTLTAADYNWPTTGTPTEVALWLLEPGMYSVGSGVSARFNTTEYFSRGLAIVTPKDSAGYTGILQIDSQGSGASAQGKLYSVTPSGGNAYSPSVFPLTLVQTTGASSTTVMSQNAVTKMVFNDPDRKTQIRISGNGDESISLGSLAHASTLAIAIGAKSSMVPGNGASATGTGSIAIGANITGPNGHPWAAGAYSIAIGSQTYAEQNSVAIGYGANATQQGQVDISTGALTTAGYNNSNYRLLTGLYDPQSDHDAATKGYVDTSITTAISGIVGVEFEVVQTLPATGDAGTIYLVPNQGTAPNIYDEYIYVNNAFEKIGTTEIDLSNYVTTTDLNTALANYTTTANLATVATSGDYNDLINTPTTFTTNEWNALWA